ncbi:hypothetical protein WMY93_009857 [Mugilogobius chulae]|uniref:Uncharacterized protein n=1 Tax=Mugilogobius chulae TaxID=88201 RepID=A0AAW0PI20_9GOBI
MEKMKTTIRETQELINLLSEELIEVKSIQEYHWHLDTDKRELKTWTKALHMKQVKLEKELASIKITVEQLEKVNSDRSAQRLEAIQLNKHVLTLYDQIDQKKMLEAQLKYVSLISLMWQKTKHAEGTKPGTSFRDIKKGELQQKKQRNAEAKRKMQTTEAKNKRVKEPNKREMDNNKRETEPLTFTESPCLSDIKC